MAQTLSWSRCWRRELSVPLAQLATPSPPPRASWPICYIWCHAQDQQASLERAKELNIDVIGVSFQVGSGCTDPETFVQAISNAHCVFDMRAEVCFNMYLLDIDGGFPGSEDAKLKFEEITSVINRALDKYFPSHSGVTFVAEPGRCYVASTFMLAVNIIAKKLVLKNKQALMIKMSPARKPLWIT
ncbi:hypothetical protein QTO34_018133 [Cnephaeus nilssonii]|uniref:Ornithine decarboxylase n=1 Tax=Cnephaeus nilssonii TaxID=3371016 RepID=A0AA40HYC9_CNENI|nr:hypothetical protein QTO34_018133 [Eptesicus nilssonii]